MECAGPVISAELLKSLAAEYDLQLDDDTLEYIFECNPVRITKLIRAMKNVKFSLSGTPFYQWTKFLLLEFATNQEPCRRPDAKPDRVYHPINPSTVVYEVGYTASVAEPFGDVDGGYYAIAKMKREEVIAGLECNEVLV